MGAFDDVDQVMLPDPTDAEEAAKFRKKWGWDEHEYVKLRGRYTAAHMRQVTNASTKAKGANLAYQLGDARIELLKCMIIDWSFTRNGNVIPVSPEAIMQLPAEYQTPILQRCDEIAKNMPEEAQQDFLTYANGHTQETLDLEKLFQRKS